MRNNNRQSEQRAEKPLPEDAGTERLKQLLKRAVMSETAPDSLRFKIRNLIRQN